MPVNRETETAICSELPPNMTILTPTIKLGLIEEVSKRTTDPVDLKHIGIKTILSYPENTHQIYTDGSASKGSKNAGFGARIEYSDKTCDELSEPCGALCANYEAEALAIKHVLLKLRETFETVPTKKGPSVIFSDSLSVLEALDNQNYETKAIRDLAMQISSFLEDFGIVLVLQWKPSHFDISGNE